MKVFKTGEYLKIENPTPGEPYRPEVLTDKDGAKNLGGMFGLLAPGTQVPYHYHNKRESVINVISGEGIEIMDGEEFPISAGDIIFVPVGVKHTTINNSEKELRYIEFYTNPPVGADFVEVKED